jgi:hypothetical protein
MSTEEKRFSVRFPPALLEDLKQLAREDDRSINAEIVRILAQYVKTRKKGARRDAYNFHVRQHPN